jgi:hypothetical protein
MSIVNYNKSQYNVFGKPTTEFMIPLPLAPTKNNNKV